jgi:hypothetical protein
MTNLFKSVLSVLFFIVFQMNISQAQDILGKWILSDFKISLHEKDTIELKKHDETYKDGRERFLEMGKGKVIMEFTTEGLMIQRFLDTDRISELGRGTWRIEGEKLFIERRGWDEEDEIVEGKLIIITHEQGFDCKEIYIKQ